MISSSCYGDSCPVHNRVDGEMSGLCGGTAWVTYVGDYAIFTDEQVRPELDPAASMSLALEALGLRFSGASEEEIQKVVSRVANGITAVFKVGPKGALANASEPPVETFESELADIKARHDMAVNAYRMVGEYDSQF